MVSKDLDIPYQDNQSQAVDRAPSVLYASKKLKYVINLQRLFMVYSKIMHDRRWLVILPTSLIFSYNFFFLY
jgi:hypothetical protein